MKLAGLIFVLMTLFAGSAVAQSRQPAQPTTLPLISPQQFDILDRTGAWAPFGTVDTSLHVFQATGVRIFGVDPTGVQDATAAINAALASSTSCWYLPKGTYKITDALIGITTNSGTIGGCLRGDGARNTILAVDSATFNLAAQGVIVFPSTPGQSFTLRDIGFEFTQPQVSSRASLVHFPPAIYAQDAGRFVLKNIYIGAPDVCLDARGNSGGAFIDTVECGALTSGMKWGGGGASGSGSLDFVHISNWHHWPFGAVLIGVATPLHTVYADGNNNCATLGRIDTLQAVNWSCFQGSLVITADATNGGLYQDFANLALDGLGATLNVAGGRVRIDNGYTTSAKAGAADIALTGGTLQLVNFWALTGAHPNVAAIQVTSGALTIQGGTYGCADATISCISVTGGSLGASNATFAPGAAFVSVPFIFEGGGSLSLRGGLFNVPANGVGVKFATDSANNQINNVSLNGWTVQTPVNPVFGQYGFYATASSMMANRNLTLNPANPAIALQATGVQPADQHNWDLFEDDNGDITLRAYDDAVSVFNQYFHFIRGSGYSLSGGRVQADVPVRLAPFTVAALPTCGAGVAGSIAYVSDASAAPTYWGAAAGGGAVNAPVFCNGVSWVYH